MNVLNKSYSDSKTNRRENNFNVYHNKTETTKTKCKASCLWRVMMATVTKSVPPPGDTGGK